MRSASTLLSVFVAAAVAWTVHAQPGGPLRIDKIDPPNWYATLPKPMLLVRGEGMRGAEFSLSDASLHIERTQVSDNGHWVLRTSANAMVYARFGSSGCPDRRRRAGDPRPMLVVVERGDFTPLQLDLHATGVAVCHPGAALMGQATASVKGDQVILAPATSFAVLPRE